MLREIKEWFRDLWRDTTDLAIMPDARVGDEPLGLRPADAVTARVDPGLAFDAENYAKWQLERTEITAGYHAALAQAGLKIESVSDRTWPHCDDLVVHAPWMKCAVCNEYAEDLQAARVYLDMNFTGEYHTVLLPDPATQSRPEATLRQWRGNVPIEGSDLQQPDTREGVAAVAAGGACPVLDESHFDAAPPDHGRFVDDASLLHHCVLCGEAIPAGSMDQKVCGLCFPLPETSSAPSVAKSRSIKKVFRVKKKLSSKKARIRTTRKKAAPKDGQ